DQPLDRIGDRQELVDAGAPPVPGVSTLLAAHTLHGVDMLRTVRSDLPQHLDAQLDGLRAPAAHAAHESLREHAQQRRGQQVVLDTHLEQSRHRAGGVVRVQGREHQVAGQRGLDGDLGGLRVADLTDHDDVGVLAHDGAQPAGEGEADRRLHVDLVHPEELVLDGILGGDDLLVGRLDLVERAVQRGGFAAARGSGDQDHAVGPLDELGELAERVLREAQRLEVHDDAGAVEDAEHDALAVQRRQGRDTEIDLLAHHAQLDAAVLRQATLRDVELRHDLDARHDRGGQAARRRLDVVQHAVDAVADLELVLERLDVDVGGTLLDGPVDDEVDHADDRRLAGQIAQVIDVLLVVGEELEVALSAITAAVPALARALAVGALERLQHVALARQARLDLEPGRHLQALQRVVVARVGHGDGQGAVLLGQRQDLGPPRVLQVELAERNRLGREVASRHDLDAQVRGEQRLEVLLGDEPEIEQQALEPFTALLLEPPDLAQVLGADAPLIEQELLERAISELH